MKLAKLTAALVAAGLALPVCAAAPKTDAATLHKLMERMEKLEARNAELEKEVKTLKNESAEIAKGLESERISQYEPELTSRLKATEKDVLDMKKPSKIAEALDGIKVSANVATVAQRAYGFPSGTNHGGSQLNYRGDIAVELPLQSIGDVEQKIFAHVRVGQGLGLNPAFTALGYFGAAPNAVAFQASGANPDDSVLVLGEIWYQAAIPLPFGGFLPDSRETLELTFGKMDIFTFFDQNTAAGDETTQFLNSVFVHNPLLDAGGEVGVDANGFQPGFVTSYVNSSDKSQPWRLSLAVFGAGERGSNYQRSFDSPLYMAQAETQLKLFDGLTGNYRLYGWTRSDADNFDGTTSRHTGVGVSVDQRVGDGVNLFGRFGHLAKGDLPFKDVISIGADISGSYWGRANDAIGIGYAWLNSNSAYRNYGGSGDLDGDGIPDFTFIPSNAENVAEIYYRFSVSPQFQLTPDLQWITRGGGNGDADPVTVIGLRANIAY